MNKKGLMNESLNKSDDMVRAVNVLIDGHLFDETVIMVNREMDNDACSLSDCIAPSGLHRCT